jgi:hypothetical protein
MSKKLAFTLFKTVSNNTFKEIAKDIFSAKTIFTINKGKALQFLNGIFQFR